MIKQRDFLSALIFMYHAIAKNDLRVFTNGLRMEFRDGVCDMTATDGIKVAKMSLVLPVEKKMENDDVLVSRSSIDKMIKMFPVARDDEPDITIQDHQEGIIIKSSKGLTIVPELIDGTQPDMVGIIPQGKLKAISSININPKILKETCAAFDKIAPTNDGVLIESFGKLYPIKISIPKEYLKAQSVIGEVFVIIATMKEQ